MASATSGRTREPLIRVKVPIQLITGTTPTEAKVGTLPDPLVLVLGLM